MVAPPKPVPFGRVNIFPLLDCMAHIELEFFFQSDKQKPMLEKLNLWRQLCEGSGAQAETAQLPMRGFLVVLPSREKILFDTGFGPWNSPRTLEPRNMLLDALKQTGTDVGEVEYVVISHLHQDHTGWIINEDGALTFPKAKHVFMAAEIDFWGSSEANRIRTAFDQRIVPLLNSPDRIRQLNEQRTVLLEKDGVCVELLHLPGHTPGHQVMRIQDTGSSSFEKSSGASNASPPPPPPPPTAYFVGDSLHFSSQVSCPECSVKVDHDPILAAENRAKLLGWIEQYQAILVSPHLKGVGCWKVQTDRNGKRTLQPLDA